MLYKDVLLTTEMLDAMVGIVSQADDDDLLRYVRSHKKLANGFKITKAGSATFRKRLIAQLRSTKELDNATAAFLYENSLGKQFFLVLSVEAIQEHLKQFFIIFGRINVLLALLLDERPELNELAISMLEASEDEEPDDRKRACAYIIANMTPFVDHFTTIMREVIEDLPENDQQDPEVVDNAHNDELQRLLIAEQKRNGLLSQKLQEYKEEVAAKQATQSERIAKLTTERDELRQLTVHAEQKIAMLLQEAKRNRQELDAIIEENVKARLSAITNRWLQTRETIDYEVQHIASHHDLIDKADTAICLQQQADRHTGNRHTLQQRLQDIISKLAEIREAVSSALHPLDGLSAIEAELQVEADRLRQLLDNGQSAELSPLAKSLATRIGATTGGDGLHQCETLLEKLCGLGLPSDDCRYLQNLLGERYDQLLAAHGTNRELPIQPLNPALRFRQALAQGKPSALICDGHNIINCMDQFEKVRSRDHAEARQLLTDTLAIQLKQYPHLSVTIVYDGPEHNKLQETENVAVIYSGGGCKLTKHRADRRITELLNWSAFTETGEQLFVVSADNDVVRESRENRAQVIPLDQFGYMFFEGEFVSSSNTLPTV